MAKLVVVALITLGSLICKAEGAGKAVSVDREAVRREVKTHLAEVKTCYDDAIKKDSKLGEGKIVIQFEVDETGKITSAKANEQKSTLKNSDVEQCLVKKFKSWTFPASPKGTIVAVSYPFVFKRDQQPAK